MADWAPYSIPTLSFHPSYVCLPCCLPSLYIQTFRTSEGWTEERAGGRPGPGWTQKTEELKNVIVGLASHPPDGRARGGTAEWEVAAASSHRPTPSASSDRISSIGCLTPSISPYWSQLARGKIHVRLSVSATFPPALK